jgi:Cu+-exporting ATPase
MDDHTTAQKRIDFHVSGMTCAACVRRVERAAAKIDGVAAATVNLATEKASIEFNNPSPDRVAAVRKAISDAGYSATLVSEPVMADDAGMVRDLVIACSLALPILVGSMGPMMIPGGMDWMMARLPMDRWNQILWFLATAVQIVPGWRFYRHGWTSLRSLYPDMNLLVAIGTTAAYGYSSIATWFPDRLPLAARHVYFESSAVVIAFVLLGKVLENRSKHRSREAIQALGKLQPRLAHRIQTDGIHDVDIQRIAVGDLLEIYAGESVPMDGVVVDGTSYVDESMVSGEPIPQARKPGDKLIGGTVNGNGMLRVRVVAIGNETLLSRITAMVEDAQAAKPPIQQTVDQVVARFVPAVLAIACVTAMAWLFFGGEDRWSQAMLHSVAVLIVACPCAMGLATPISMMVGTGRAAELGILFRSGEAFQSLADVDRIAFDKTGTLTSGSPKLQQVDPLPPWNESQLGRYAASAAATSQHPVSRAIAQANLGSEPPFDARHSDHFPGSGIVVELDTGVTVHLGSPAWLEHLGFASDATRARQDLLFAGGATVVGIAIDGAVAGWITVADPAKPEGTTAIQQLTRLGLTSWILSGDHPVPVQGIARALGIEHGIGNLLPNQKADQLQAWQREGIATAFVGDGINDAPALASARVGIGLGTGTEIAVSTADVVLISGNLLAVPTAIQLARAVMRNIRMNLAWAFGYNLILIPVAAGLLVPFHGWSLTPVLCALAMSFSSVFVVANALRLRTFSRRLGDHPLPTTS